MDRKIKTDWNAFMIIGIIFTILGAIFTTLGIALYVLLPEEGPIMLLCFGLCGMPFLLIGLIFLIWQVRKRKLAKKLVAEGNYVLAEIMEVSRNFNVNVNGRYPFIVRCKYEDSHGTVHIFQSRSLFFNPESLFRDQFVRVYLNRDNYKQYYVDIDGVLPRVENH